MNIQSLRKFSFFGKSVVDCVPTGTYRFQFHHAFPFAAARAEIPYLVELGISHVYSSPILSARPGSMHGYDTIDYTTINPELGGEEAFLALSHALRAAGIGIILDIVPNHMAITGGLNRYWQDVLRQGAASPYARWFDIDFDRPDARLHGRVHLPFLGDAYRSVLERGEIHLVRQEDGTHALTYGDHVFPIRPDVESEIAMRGLAPYSQVDELDALIARQHYALDWWRNAGDRINWRRFFDITELAAVRMEVPEAFNAAHALPFRLYRDGLIDGLRIDHVDGLADPAAYCRDLRAALDEIHRSRPAGLQGERAYIVVEKILAKGEQLPHWDVAGTTGYDFMDEVSALQHDADAEPVLDAVWEAASGRSRAFETEEETARREILAFGFADQLERLIEAMRRAAGVVGVTNIPSRHAIGRAVELILTEMHAYRTYTTAAAPGGGPFFAAALEKARASALRDDEALDLIAAVIDGPVVADDDGLRTAAIRRFNQLSAPLAAKAVEDTAFYRYGRLLSRNDVGFDAATLGISPAQFHHRMAERSKQSPNSMLATATHDHKRGEDVRARLASLSEMPERLAVAAQDWLKLSGALDRGMEPADAYMLFQTIVGVADPGLDADDEAALASLADRLCGWMTKALREAKLRSSWTAPDADYEAIALGVIRHVLTEAEGRAARKHAFDLASAIAPVGAANALAQMVLRLMLPGMPDTYQGTEFWDFSLVDPDNRRPVDFAARRAALAKIRPLSDLAADWQSGHVKQSILRSLLRFRQSERDIFAKGSYEPVAVTGERANNVLAFVRRSGSHGCLVVVGRLMAEALADQDRVAPDATWWGDTEIARSTLALSRRATLAPVIGGAIVNGAIRLGRALQPVPVAVWRF
jgi:(1->4)-alpha-D-glucan 1-alpha-D-glucosylmutase